MEVLGRRSVSFCAGSAVGGQTMNDRFIDGQGQRGWSGLVALRAPRVALLSLI